MDIILIGGLWLDASAWDAVLPGLRDAGHTPVAVALPGQGDGNTSATLADQLDAVLATIDAASGPVLVVGHSASATLAWLAAERRPEKVARVAFIGGMPTGEGDPYAPFFPVADGVVPFPGWEPFTGPDSDDLDDATKEQVAANAHPVPEGVVMAPVAYGGTARHGVPAVEICPEFSPEDAKGWVEGGQAPELAAAESLEYVDIDSGHWPMFSKPDELARVIADLAT